MVHLTHFSDVIGASHSTKYTQWALGTYASDGLKELAEWGNTYKMEMEMKERVSILGGSSCLYIKFSPTKKVQRFQLDTFILRD